MAERINYYRPVERLGRLLRTERKLIYLVLFLALINGVIVLTLPLGIQAILNFIMGGRVSSSWALLVVLVALGLVVSGLIQIGQLSLTEKLQQRIFTRSSFELAVRIPRIKLEAMRNRYPPEMVNQFFDTVNLQKGIAKLLVDFPTAALQVCFGLILISIYHPAFFFFSLGIIFLLYLLFKFTGPQGVSSSINESTNKYEVAHWLEELARTMGTFKLAGITDLPLVTVDRLLMGYLHFRNKHFGILIMQYKAMIAFKVFTIVVMLITGSLLLIENEISLGQFVAVEIIIILIMNSIEKLIIGLETVYDVLTSLEKLGAITDLELEEEKANSPTIPLSPHGLAIGIKNLSFGYNGKGKKVIDKFSLHIKAGEKIALTGNQGAGKSTLMQLFTGVYEKYEGSISFNGFNLSSLRKDKLRCDIGDNIWQETIFKGTLRDNITLGKSNISDQMINEALEVASAIDEINFLEEGLNTQLFPEGIKLPRTLTKKLILARSIVANPRLLLLELETNFLLKSEEQKFYDYVFSKDWTVVASTRDEAYLSRANRILFMEQGSTVFSGDFNAFKLTDHAKLIR